MMEITINGEKRTIGWRLMLVKGLFFILAGLFFIVCPRITYMFVSAAINTFLGLAVVIIGVLSIFISLLFRRFIGTWILGFAFGLLATISGLLLVIHPAASAAALPFLAGIWLLFEAVSLFGAALDMKRTENKKWVAPLIGGISILIFAVMIMFDRTLGALAFVYGVALSFLFKGTTDLCRAFALKKAGKESQKNTYDAEYREI